MRRINLSSKNLLVSLLGLLLICSCGKKTMVRAPVEIRPPAVGNLKCHVRKNFVELEWQIPDWTEGKKLGRKISAFQIWRATITPSERDCPGCPKKFSYLSTVDLSYPYPAHVIGKRILWKDLGVRIGNQYYYRLITVDNEGNESLISNTTMSNVSYPPQAPRLTQAIPTHNGIELNWEDPEKTVTGKNDLRPRKYILYKRISGSEWKRAFHGFIKERSYLDRKVEPGKTYEYRVRILADEDGTPTFSDFSNIVTAVALELPPPAPPDTVWVLPSQNGVGIYWLRSEVDKHQIRYNVYRKTEDGKVVRLTEKPIDKTTFLDKNVKINRLYKYSVTSVRMGKEPSEGPYSKWVEIRFVPL